MNSPSLAVFSDIILDSDPGFSIESGSSMQRTSVLHIRHYGKLVAAFETQQFGIRLFSNVESRRFADLSLSDPQFIEKVRTFIANLCVPEDGFDPYLEKGDAPKPELNPT